MTLLIDGSEEKILLGGLQNHLMPWNFADKDQIKSFQGKAWCDTMLGIRCARVPIRRFLYLFWCETPTKGLRARFPTRPEEDEGRKVREWTEETRAENRAVDRSATAHEF